MAIMEDAWLPPGQRSIKNLERELASIQRNGRISSNNRSVMSQSSFGADMASKRNSMAASPLPVELSSSSSAERSFPQDPRNVLLASGLPDSVQQTGHWAPSEDLAHTFDAAYKGNQFDVHLDDEDHGSCHSAHSQAIPDLPDREKVLPMIRQPSAIKALQTELMVLHRELDSSICKVALVDSDLFNWEVELSGPENSPYQGGFFRFLLKFPEDYPDHMPRIRCATPIFHCNIDQSGNVCLGDFDEGGLSPDALVPKIDDASLELHMRTQLRIGIVHARSLRNADFGGVSDPYCTCQVPEKDWSRFHTSVANDTLNPVWNEEHVINDYTPGDALSFEIYDDDDDTSNLQSLDPDDELLGKVTLDSAAFYPDGFDGELQLTSTGKSHRSSVHVKVSVILPRLAQTRNTVLDIVEAVLSLLTLPMLTDPLVPSAARLFQEDRDQYDRLAREWTLKYAL